VIRDDLLTGPSDEEAGAALARLNEFNAALRDSGSAYSDWVYQVEYVPVARQALAEAEQRLNIALPPGYTRLLSVHGLPILRYGGAGGDPMLIGPDDMYRGDFYVDEDEDLEHVPEEDRDAVMDRLRVSVVFHQPDVGVYNYAMFRTDLVRADGEMPVAEYVHDEVYDDPRGFFTFDQYVSALVDDYNRSQSEDFSA
jgi:hypothetical protein